MGRKHRAQIISTTECLKNTWGEILLSKFRELQVTVRSEGRWFDNEGIARQERWADLSNCQHYWEIPWHDSTSNSQGHVSVDDLPFLCVFEDFFRQVQVSCALERQHRCVDFRGSLGERFSLLSYQEMSKLVPMTGNPVGKGDEGLATLFKGNVFPLLESSPCVDDGIVDVLLRRDWNLSIWLCGGGVDAVTGCRRRGQLAIDNIAESLSFRLIN